MFKFEECELEVRSSPGYGAEPFLILPTGEKFYLDWNTPTLRSVKTLLKDKTFLVGICDELHDDNEKEGLIIFKGKQICSACFLASESWQKETEAYLLRHIYMA